MMKSETLPRKCYLQIPGLDFGTDDGQSWTQADTDKYTASIELSNKCRDFYKSRLEAANTIKAKWRHSLSDSSDSASSSGGSSPMSSSSSISSQEDEKTGSGRQKSGIDAAMERLRAEVVSFIDQDLSLMKQLLTLNETIEELKWQRQYYSCSTSCASLSSSKLLDSNWSVSDTEMYEADDDLVAAANHVTGGLQAQAGTVAGPTWHGTRKARKALKDLEMAITDSVPSVLDIIVDVSVDNCSQRNPHDSVYSETLDSASHLNYTSHSKSDSAGQSVIHHDRDQNSFDSGIHEDLVWAI